MTDRTTTGRALAIDARARVCLATSLCRLMNDMLHALLRRYPMPTTFVLSFGGVGLITDLSLVASVLRQWSGASQQQPIPVRCISISFHADQADHPFHGRQLPPRPARGGLHRRRLVGVPYQHGAWRHSMQQQQLRAIDLSRSAAARSATGPTSRPSSCSSTSNPSVASFGIIAFIGIALLTTVGAGGRLQRRQVPVTRCASSTTLPLKARRHARRPARADLLQILVSPRHQAP